LVKPIHNKTLPTRLTRLENKVYGAPKPSIDLYDRVEALSTTVLGTSRPITSNDDDNETIMVSPNNDETSDAQPMTDTDIASATGQMEQALFKQTYVNEPLNQRLSRLETKIFHRTQPDNIPNQQRFQRIMAGSEWGCTRSPTILDKGWVRHCYLLF
jgi:hypothetical protein